MAFLWGQASASLWNHNVFWPIQRHNSATEGEIVTIVHILSDTEPWNCTECVSVLRIWNFFVFPITEKVLYWPIRYRNSPNHYSISFFFIIQVSHCYNIIALSFKTRAIKTITVESMKHNKVRQQNNTQSLNIRDKRQITE